MPTRCCWPPESSLRKVVLAAGEADELDHLARPRLALRARRRPGSRAGRRRCRAPRGAAAARSAGTPCPCGGGGARSARARRRASRSAPSNRISPAVGSTSRDRQRTSVDLPEPDRPMMTKISPARMSSVTSRDGGDQAGRGESSCSVGARPAAQEAGRVRRRRASRRRGRRAWSAAFAHGARSLAPSRRDRPCGTARRLRAAGQPAMRRSAADGAISRSTPPARFVRRHPFGDHRLDRLALEVDLGDHRAHLVVVDA